MKIVLFPFNNLIFTKSVIPDVRTTSVYKLSVSVNKKCINIIVIFLTQTLSILIYDFPSTWKLVQLCLLIV